MKKGNVYTHDLTKSIAQRYPVMDGNEREIRRIVSKTTKRGEVGTGPTVYALFSLSPEISFTVPQECYCSCECKLYV